MNTIALFTLVASFLFAQPTEPAQGPIIDALVERRIEAVMERVQELELRNESRLADLVQSVKEIREERQTILETFRDFNQDRVGLVARIGEVRDEIRSFGERWTPLQNLVDRLTALVWKLFLLICVLGGLLLLLGFVGLILYWKLKAFVISKILT